MSALDYPRDVGDGHLLMVVEPHHAHVGFQSGERIRSDLKTVHCSLPYFINQIFLIDAKTLGLALDTALKRVDLPALGNPTRPTCAIVFSSATINNFYNVPKPLPYYSIIKPSLTNVKDELFSNPAAFCEFWSLVCRRLEVRVSSSAGPALSGQEHGIFLHKLANGFPFLAQNMHIVVHNTRDFK